MQLLNETIDTLSESGEHVTIVMQIALIEGSVSVWYFPCWWTENKMCCWFNYELWDQQFSKICGSAW